MSGSLAKSALAIDEIVRRGNTRLVDIAAALEIPKSSAHRLLGALVRESILRRDEHGLYSLGARLVGWGAAAEANFDVRSVALRHMQTLRDQLGETINFHVPNGDHRVCIVALQGIYPLVPIMPLGRAMPLGRGSAGILLLSYASPEIRAQVLARLEAEGEQVPTPADLAQARRDRWWKVTDDLEAGFSAASAAVLAPDGSIVGALALGGSAGRLTPARMEGLRPAMLDCADRIGRELPAQF